MDVDELQVVEKYAILLIGASKRPVPSKTHLQKEMFILTMSFPALQEYFCFQAYHFGTYSQVLDEIIADPMYYEDAVIENSKGISLSETGRRIYNDILSTEMLSQSEKELIIAMRLIRQLYDALSHKELLFLVYETYPEYAKLSGVADSIIGDRNTRLKLLKSLLDKGAITEKRYMELLVK